MGVAGRPHSIRATSDPAQQMDQGQADDGDGPCLHALSTGEPVSVHDYTDDDRWPATSDRAHAAGIRSTSLRRGRTPDRESVAGGIGPS